MTSLLNKFCFRTEWCLTYKACLTKLFLILFNFFIYLSSLKNLELNGLQTYIKWTFYWCGLQPDYNFMKFFWPHDGISMKKEQLLYNQFLLRKKNTLLYFWDDWNKIFFSFKSVWKNFFQPIVVIHNIIHM